MAKKAAIKKVLACFFIIAILMSAIPASAQPSGALEIYVKNEAGSSQSGAEVVRYDSNWDYIDTKTTSSSGYVSWSGISTGTYIYEVYYSGEFWGGGEETVSSGSTTKKYFQKYTPYVDSVSIKDVNGNAKTTFAPSEMVHVDVTLKNPSWVDYYTKATLRIDQDKTASYTLEETHGPVYTYAGNYAYFGWDWNIPTTASGTYYINPLALMDISNKYILTDDAGWSWSFNVVQSTATLTYRVHNIGTDPLPGAGGSITVKVYDSSTLVTQDTKNFNGGASHLDFSFTLNSGKTYRFKTHQTPSIGLQLEEYWGYKDVAVSSSGTVDFNRNLPYVNFVGTYTQLDVGQSVVPKVTLYNPNSGTLSGKAKLIIDQSKSSLYDYEQKSSSALISGSSSRDYDMPSFSPSSTGTYYYYALAYAYTDGAYRITDQSVWPEYVDVVQPTGSLTGRVTDSSGKDINGATVTLGSWTTTTDNTAHYIFIDKTKEEYDFKVEKTGYNTYTGTATVGSGTTTKDVQLTTWQSPEIELTPSSHDFGEVQTTVSTAPFSFTLKNVGGGTATGEVSLTGSGKDQFIITSGKSSFSLDTDQTKTIGVAFSPTSPGSKSATLYAKGSNCNDDQSSLSGTGGEIEPSPHELDYDNIAKYMSSAITFYSGYTDNWFNTKYWHNLAKGTVSGGVSTSFEKSFKAPANSMAEQFVYPKYLHSTLGAASIAEGIISIGASYLSIFYGMSSRFIGTLIDTKSSYSKIITDLDTLKENSKDIRNAAENRDENIINKLFVARKNILEELYRKLPMYDLDVRTNANRGNEYWHRTFLTSGTSYNACRTVKSFIISLHLQLQEDYIFTTYQLNRMAGRESFEELNLVVNAPIRPTRFDNDPGCSVLIGCVDAIGGSNEFEIILGANDVSSNKKLHIELAYCPKTKDDLDGITMYVKYGEKPTTSSYDEKGRHITIKNPKQGSYYVLLKAENVPGMYKLVAQVYKPNWLRIPICKSVTISSKGFVAEQYPQPEVVDIRVDKSEISLNEWVTLTVKVKNKGGNASWQSIAISSPNVTNVDSYEILSHNIDYFEKYDIGYEAGFNYGTGTTVLEYPLIEGGKFNWTKRFNGEVKLKIKPNPVGALKIYVKSVAFGEGVWQPNPEIFGSPTKDQQEEYVHVKEVTVIGDPETTLPKLCTSSDPPSTNFGTVEKDQTRTWDFFITNCGSGTLTWTITCDQPSWLNVNPAMGSPTALDVVTVTINTHDLTPGLHTGQITIDSNGGHKTGTITVEVPSKPSTPNVGFKGIVFFPCTYGDFTGQGIEVTNILSDPNGKLANCKNVCTYWTEDTLAQIDNVAPGDEVEVYGTLIEDPDVADVWMIVRLETSTHYIVRLKQGPPQLCTSPTTTSHDFGTVAKDQTRTWNFDVRNCGSGTLTWSVSDAKNGISVYPTSGSTTTERDTVTVRIDTHGLSPGTYTGHITLTSNGGEKTGTITVVVPKPKPQNQPPENPTLTPDRSSPQLAGTTIKWTASATDPNGDPLYYQFRLKGPATGNSWQIKRDWNTARTWTWYTTASGVGESDVSVRIRDGHHAQASSYDLKKTVYDYKITAAKKRPTATIDSITPNPATQGDDTVRFKGHGYDSDGYIVDYYWKSSKDGKLSSSKEFTKSASNLDVGTHTIYFKVKDNDGQWSDWATATLKIKEKKEESKYVKFRGVVTGKSALIGAVTWYVNVDEWISGSISCNEIEVVIVIVPGDMGSYDPDISKGDRVEVYGKVNPWGDDKCKVGLNGESYYYIKKV